MAFFANGYELPKSESNYLEFEDGENRFRILSNCVTGWLWWQDEQGHVLSNPAKKCHVIYVRDLSEIPQVVQASPNLRPKHIWCFVIFNRKTEQVQVCKLIQTSIMRGIASYVNNPDWGDPTAYDFVISKQGDGLSTKYSVMVGPKQPLDEGILVMYREMSIDLEAYFRGEDPFGGRDETEVQAQPQPNANGPVRPPVQANGTYVPR
jgi:hypothetical protein